MVFQFGHGGSWRRISHLKASKSSERLLVKQKRHAVKRLQSEIAKGGDQVAAKQAKLDGIPECYKPEYIQRKLEERKEKLAAAQEKVRSLQEPTKEEGLTDEQQDDLFVAEETIRRLHYLNDKSLEEAIATIDAAPGNSSFEKVKNCFYLLDSNAKRVIRHVSIHSQYWYWYWYWYYFC
jgi:hypothetical protein